MTTEEADRAWCEAFEFIPPPVMVDGELQLKLVEMQPYNPLNGRVPAYIFAMIQAGSGKVMGGIDLRVGLNEKLRQLGGHIGYRVYEPYRGNHLAARSCRLLMPFARRLGINPLLITCDPANIASVKTIESLGGIELKTHDVEIEPGVFRPTRLYHVYVA